MDDGTPGGGIVTRLRDPVRARKIANLAGLILATASGLSFALLDGSLRSLALGACWLLLIPMALWHGWAYAFFLEHGIGLRRAVAELVAGALIALSACAFLSYRGGGAVGLGFEVVISVVLYVALYYALSAIVGLGIGRGAGYLGRRIQDVDDAGW